MKYSEQIEMYTTETSLPKIAEVLASWNHPASWYSDQIIAWMGIPTTFDNDNLAKFTFSYLVQNVMHDEKEGKEIVPEEIVKRSVCDAKMFITNHPYIFAERTSEGEEGKRKKRSGPSKKERAGAIYEAHKEEGRAAVINALVEELEMSKAGAGTYYNNFKSGKWEV